MLAPLQGQGAFLGTQGPAAHFRVALGLGGVWAGPQGGQQGCPQGWVRVLKMSSLSCRWDPELQGHRGPPSSQKGAQGRRGAGPLGRGCRALGGSVRWGLGVAEGKKKPAGSGRWCG